MKPSLTAISRIEWGRSYLWEVCFPEENIPAPFDEWFPAVTVREPLASITAFDFAGGQSSYKVPKATHVHEIAITFVDDANHTLQNWLCQWINGDILHKNVNAITVDRVMRHEIHNIWIGAVTGIGYLKEVAKVLRVQKLLPDRSVLQKKEYFVFPEVDLIFEGNQESSRLEFEATFVVVGENS